MENRRPVLHGPTDDIRQIRVLVAGLACNCATVIAAEIANLRNALKKFSAVSWLVIESDSQDNTIAVLEDLQHTIPNFRFISLGVLREKLRIRTERIAYCRNVYQDEIANNPLYGNIDYVIVTDLDGTNDLLTEQAILSCWDRSGWDVCTANQRSRYYDIWALRHPSWCPSDSWREFYALISRGVDHERAREVAVYSKMRRIKESSAWIEVDSAFGGMAIYRRAALDGAHYNGLTFEGEEACEHVTLHAHIRSKGYRIFINPKLINTGDTKHTAPTSIGASIKRKLRILMRSSIKGAIGVKGIQLVKKLRSRDHD